MGRIHGIELHEQTWYPAFLRKIFQRGLGHSLTITNTFDRFTGPFGQFLEQTRSRAILDLCSGSGDAARAVWKEIFESLEPDRRPTLWLSDLFPNLEAYERLRAEHPGAIEFLAAPVDALQPPKDAPRVRTLFNCFHHFRPEQARQILADATENADGIAIFEVTRNHWKNHLVTVLVLPFASAFLTSFLLRPFRLSHVLFSFLLPVIPFTAAFDGLFSNLRTYSVEELEAMTRSLGDRGFEWEIGHVEVEKTGLLSTYLFGWRKHPQS